MTLLDYVAVGRWLFRDRRVLYGYTLHDILAAWRESRDA